MDKRNFWVDTQYGGGVFALNRDDKGYPLYKIAGNGDNPLFGHWYYVWDTNGCRLYMERWHPNKRGAVLKLFLYKK